VYAFEAAIDRTRVIKGIAKEKKQAKREYEEAKRKGRTAALLDQQSEEVFEMSLGNIKPKSTIDINISLFSIVEHDGTPDTLRLTFPTTIAPHYGRAPTSTTSTTSVVELTLGVTASAPIQSIKSTSHPIETVMGRTTESDAMDFDPTLSRVKLSSTQFLQTDVVVVIRYKGLDRPRCTVESFSVEEGAEEHTEAYALTIVPRFESAVIPSQEYIFLIDRSGSMEGEKMAAVRSAMRIMLASLPASGTTFNIVSFGSHHDSLWSSSKSYDTETVEDALRHVDRMTANYGGTEIAAAIDGAVNVRKVESGRPTSVFILTDGEAWDLDGVSAGVQKHVQAANTANSPLKFFCMGIGNSPSKALVDAIARAGNGASLFVREDEGASAKLVTLLRAARSAPVENLNIDWGVNVSPQTSDMEEDFEVVPPYDAEKASASAPAPQPMSLFDESATSNSQDVQLGPASPPSVTLAPPPRLQQAPSLESLPPLYAGFRFSVFAIVKKDAQSKDKPSQPRHVRITGTARDQPVTLDVRVQLYSASQNAQAKAKLLHVLAARALIREFEDHKPMSETDKAEVLRLAVRYGLSSSQTSFVAVEEEPVPTPTSAPVPSSTEDTELADSELDKSDQEEAERSTFDLLSMYTQELEAASAVEYDDDEEDDDMLFGLVDSSPSFAAPSGYAPSGYPSSGYVASARMAPQFMQMAQSSFPPGGSALMGSGSAPMVYESARAASYAAPPPPTMYYAPQGQSRFSFSPSGGIQVQSAASYYLAESEPQAKKDDAPTSVAGLAQLQRTDGAFPPSEQIYAVVGGAATKEHFKALFSQSSALSSLPPSNPTKADKEKSTDWDTAEILWATLLILAFLELKLADEADMWVLMAEKARTWIAAIVGSPTETSPGLEGGNTATAVESMEAEARKVIEKL
jgi:Mg-chelatase subunit ChlD